MKFRIIFLFALISSVNLLSQNEKDFNVGLESIFTTKGIFGYPSVRIGFHNIKIQSGILIGNDYVNSKTSLGVQTDIMYFPNKEGKKKFNFFFIGSVNYFKNRVSLNQSEVKTNFVQATLGYGFNYYLSDNLFIKSNLGIGVLLENRKFNFNTNDPSNKWGAAGIISFGIAYQL